MRFGSRVGRVGGAVDDAAVGAGVVGAAQRARQLGEHADDVSIPNFWHNQMRNGCKVANEVNGGTYDDKV